MEEAAGMKIAFLMGSIRKLKRQPGLSHIMHAPGEGKHPPLWPAAHEGQAWM